MALAPNKIKREAATTIRTRCRAVFIVVPPLNWEYRRAHDSSGRDFNLAISRFVQRSELGACRPRTGVLHTPVMALLKLQEHLEQALEYLSAAFAQLAFLSSVRDSYTGRYLHEGWCSIASPEEVHRVLRKTHHEVFDRVLDLTLAQMRRELSEYLRSASEAGREETGARVWLELESHRDMIPQGCSPLDRDLFLSQVRTVLGMLVNAREFPPPEEQSASKRLPLDPQPQHHWDS